MDENKETPKTYSEGEPLSRVKTYQDAIAEALRSQEMSSAGMLIAEQKKRDNLEKDRSEKSISNPKNKLLVLISISLIVLSVLIVAFAIIRSNQRPAPSNTFVLNSKFLLAERLIEIPASQLPRNTLARVQAASMEILQNGEIAHLLITKEVRADPNSLVEINIKAPYNSEDFLAMLGARVPENLRNVLDPEFFLGIHRGTANEKFILFRVTNFENGFIGMLNWETVLARDLESVFPSEIAKARTTFEENVSETIISEEPQNIDENTEELEDEEIIPQTIQRTIDNTRDWRDRVIRNTDARALLDESGQVVFFYAIIDKEYIFFGSSEVTFAEVMRRVRSSKLIR
jgi:hypothetical protein